MLLGRELVGPELDLDFVKRAGELERHLRVILVDKWRSGVLADIETLIETELQSGEVCSIRLSARYRTFNTAELSVGS